MQENKKEIDDSYNISEFQEIQKENDFNSGNYV